MSSKASSTRPQGKPRFKRFSLQRILRQLGPWLFVAPALLVFLYFKFIPIFRGMRLSFYDVGFFEGNTWVGWDHYQRALSDPLLHTATLHTFLYVGVTVVASALLGLLLALDGTALYQQMLRTAVFLPVVTSIAVVAEMWNILYYPTDYGILNEVFGWLGLGPFGFFAEPSQAFGAIMFMSIWKSVPYDMVIFVAGLAGINRELYAAAKIDGAGLLQRIFHVTLPGLSTAFTIVFTLGIIRGLRVFGEVYITTNGGPRNATEVIMTYVYKQGFNQFDFGYAAAVSTLLFFLSALLTLLYLAWQRRSA